MTCNAKWLESAETRCQLEAGHPAEHFAKATIEYPDGQIGKADISWVSEANLRSERGANE